MFVKKTKQKPVLVFLMLAMVLAIWVVALSVRIHHSGLPILKREEAKKCEFTKEHIAEALQPALNKNNFPEEIDLVTTERLLVHARTHYTLDNEMQAQIYKLMHSYKPDYAAFVAMDATTGKVLALASYTRERSKLGNLALKATFPAASVFKIVTATAAIDQAKITPDTLISFTGANHTLYRRNVMNQGPNRWLRQMTLREAFAKSVNTVFAKIGMFWLKPLQLEDYARRFRFNETTPTDLPLETGSLVMPEDKDDWAVAEIASGFNRTALMSPVQGAMMAAAVANDGVMMEPYFVDSLVSETGAFLYQSQPEQISVTMSPNTAAELRNLMRETVRHGTSRTAFRDLLRRKRFADVEIGGKTGSLRGIYPEGKCDWFVGYGLSGTRKIAVAALTVNEENWRVKSSVLARFMIERYFRSYQLSMAP